MLKIPLLYRLSNKPNQKWFLPRLFLVPHPIQSTLSFLLAYRPDDVAFELGIDMPALPTAFILIVEDVGSVLSK